MDNEWIPQQLQPSNHKGWNVSHVCIRMAHPKLQHGILKCHDVCGNICDYIQGKGGLFAFISSLCLKQCVQIFNCSFVARLTSSASADCALWVASHCPLLSSFICRDDLQINTQRGRLRHTAIHQTYLPKQTPYPTTQIPPHSSPPFLPLRVLFRSPGSLSSSAFAKNQTCDKSSEMFN